MYLNNNVGCRTESSVTDNSWQSCSGTPNNHMLGFVMMFLYIVMITLTIYLFLKVFVLNKKTKSTETLLNERLAKGEIDIEEYNIIKKEIGE